LLKTFWFYAHKRLLAVWWWYLSIF